MIYCTLLFILFVNNFCLGQAMSNVLAQLKTSFKLQILVLGHLELRIEEKVVIHEATKEELASVRRSFPFLSSHKERADYKCP